MNKLLVAAAFAFGMAGFVPIPEALAAGCYICTSGSPCQQCRYGSDNQTERKRCRDAGCKIGGTKSCSTAANIRTCRASLGTGQPFYAGFETLLDPAR